MVRLGLVGWLGIGAVLLTWPLPAPAANMLVVPVDGSHWINMKVLIGALGARGHSVTVLRSSTSLYIAEEPELYRSITVPADGKAGILEDKGKMADFVLRSLEIFRNGKTLAAFVRSTQEIRRMLAETHRLMLAFVVQILEDRELMGRLEGSGFELVITDPLSPTGVLLAHRLELPLVYNSRWLTTGDCHAAIAPSPTSYVPTVGSRYSDRMGFLQRLSNAAQYFTTVQLGEAMIHPGYDALCRRQFGPGSSLSQLTLRADLWLMRVDFVLEYPRPTMPNVVYIGGFQCRPARPLTPELEAFVQSSGPHGVILMSLGAMVDELPADLAANIAASFAELPQKVIWRHTGRPPPNLGNNTMLVKWVPQGDLLGHPKVVAFVSHGGTNGIYEAIYHGVPVVGLPLIFDQFDNLLRLESRGAALVLDTAGLQPGELAAALREVLSNPAYRRAMDRLSALHRDQPQHPLQRAVFWIEFAARHRGAAHLQPAAYALPWYAYYSLDVAAFLALLGLALAAAACLSLRRLGRALRSRKEKAA